MRRALRIIVSILFLCAMIASIVIFFVALKEEAERTDNLDYSFGIFMVLYIPFVVSEISTYFDIMYFLRNKKNKKLYKTVFRAITLVLSISIISITPVIHRQTVFLKTIEAIFLILIVAHILTKLIYYTVFCFKELDLD